MSGIRILLVFSFLAKTLTIPISTNDKVSELLMVNSTDEGNFTTDLSMISIMPIIDGEETEWSTFNITDTEDELTTVTVDNEENSTDFSTETPVETLPILLTKKFMMKESLTVSRTNTEGRTVCLTFYRHTASDDYSHAGICTAGNCYDDPDFVNCQEHFPEKFMNDNPFFS